MTCPHDNVSLPSTSDPQIVCADCGQVLEPWEVRICEPCGQNSEKYLQSVLTYGDDTVY